MADRKRGRPPLSADEQSTPVGTLKLPVSLYDRVDRVAREQRISIAEVIRRVLAREFRTTK